MANTYVAIATVTVGSGGAAQIEFTSIPQTYTDLVIKLSSRSTYNDYSDNVMLKFNSNSSNYSERTLYNVAGTAGSANQNTNGRLDFWHTSAATATASTFGSAEIYVPNYTSSNNKSVSMDTTTENNSTSVVQVLEAGLWSNSAAITSVYLAPVSGNFVQYSTAILYGIKNS